MKYKAGVNVVSHLFEWGNNRGGWKDFSPALRSTDYKCPHCLLIEFEI